MEFASAIVIEYHTPERNTSILLMCDSFDCEDTCIYYFLSTNGFASNRGLFEMALTV